MAIFRRATAKLAADTERLELESVVALACRDQQRIDELLKLYEQVAACRTDVMDLSCPMWSTRAIFALRYGRIFVLE